jgi:rhodanese-related sulfurtransferase
MWRTLTEAMLVVGAGFCVALFANAVSPRGLDLRRNYFPETTVRAPAAVLEETADGVVTPPPNPVEARLRQRGLEQIQFDDVRAWVEDPHYEMERVILVDARNRRQYREGHIPGAFSLDHYRPDETLAELLPAALAAEWVIVYCSGGDCEDSEFAAIFLRDAGVPGDRIRVYTGGLEEWRGAGLPIELGQRKSGIQE